MTTDLIPALKEALDYTRAYRDATFVVKIGGEVLGDPRVIHALAVQVALLESLSIRVVLVHGGGPQATALAGRLGLGTEMVAGRRVTTPEGLEVAKMVYAGTLNTDIVAALRAHGVRAVGLSGVDAGLVEVRRRPPVRITGDDGEERSVDFGEVGDVVSVDRRLLERLLPEGYVPVVASLACDVSGSVLNVNADTMAAALAVGLAAEKLLFLTSAPGLLRDPGDTTSVVAFAEAADVRRLVEEGVVKGGMRPKIEACLRAVEGGVRRTHIIDGRAADALLVEVFTGHGSGTMIVGAREADAYRERAL